MHDALYLLDGYGLVYRSYFALIRRPMFNPKGKNASAIYGFFRSLFSLLNDREPAYFAVALDSTTPTFRHEKFPDYKATREKTPEDLRDEIPVIEEILSRLGIPMIRVNGYEADDIMATLATRCREREMECRIVTGDKDLLQLVGGPTRVLKPESGGGFTEIDREGVIETWGVTPEQILDYLSLVGDSSDNVPGVKGIGAKTAATLLQEHPTLDAIYDNLEAVKSKSQKQKLEDGRENAYISRDLVTLKTEVPLEVELEELRMPELDVNAALPFFAAEGMKTIVRDLTGGDDAGIDSSSPLAERAEAAARRELVGAVNTAEATLGPSGAVEGPNGIEVRESHPSGGGQAAFDFDRTNEPEDSNGSGDPGEPERPAHYDYERDPEDSKPGEYELVTELEVLDAWCERIRKAGLVAFDSETTSLDAMVAEPVGFSFSTERGSACYIALRGPEGPVLPAEEVRKRLRTVLESADVSVIGQNLKYDYKVVKRWGVTIANPNFDTMVAAWLIDTEGNSFSMDNLAEQYLAYSTVHYTDVIPQTGRGEPEATFDSVDLEKACRYAAEDADVTFRLYKVLNQLLDETGLKKLFTDVEMPLLPILAEMELTGIRVDSDTLKAYSAELESELAEIQKEIFSLCGHEFNIGSTKQLQQVLFEERKLTPTKKTKTGYSTDTSVLQDLSADDPVPALVLRHRTLSKLKGTYVDALPRLINDQTGRIHTHFNVTGTATGRISSTDPNLQNIPIRDEEGRRIRGAFVPEDDWSFVSADYSQVELVVLAHLSGDPGLKEAFAAGTDVHQNTGSLIFGVEEQDVSAQQRRIAKTINFGVMYGMSAYRLSRELQIPRSDAAGFIEAYFETYPRIRNFIEKTVRGAEEHGYVQTILGRRRYLANISNRNRTVKQAAERVAVNTPIQGSAADIIKLAMITLASSLKENGLQSRLLLQVHDELILECPQDEVEQVTKLLEKVMPGAYKLSVPLQVSVEAGESWGMMH